MGESAGLWLVLGSAGPHALAPLPALGPEWSQLWWVWVLHLLQPTSVPTLHPCFLREPLPDRDSSAGEVSA